MTRLESHPELTLELARLSSEPAAGDKARNLAALRSRLGLPMPAPPPLTGTTSSVLRISPVRASRWQLLAVGAVTGALGFLLGSSIQHGPNPGQAQTQLGPPAIARGPLPLTPPLPLVPSPPSSPASVATVTERPTAEAEPFETLARPVSARSRSHQHGHSQRSSSGAARQVEATSGDFSAALQLLGRARRALDRGDAELALSLLDDLDTRFSTELLDEERGATRVLALCARGENGPALQLAERMFAGRPRSLYTRRLERSCAAAALARFEQ
jgi:hypothetical protein